MDRDSIQLAGRRFARSSPEDPRHIYAELRGALMAEGIVLPPTSEFSTELLKDIRLENRLDELTDHFDGELFAKIQFERSANEAQAIGEVVTVGFVLLGLAALSKVKYSKESGFELAEGLPGLADVLRHLPRFW